MEPQSVTTSQPTETLAHRLSLLGSSGTITVQPRPEASQCPECTHPGPHQRLDGGWVECGNYHRTRLTTGWAVCGTTWRTNRPISRPNPVRDRLIVLLAGDTDLCDGTILELADRIANDREFQVRLRRPRPGDAA